jgi:hypothetical protein
VIIQSDWQLSLDFFGGKPVVVAPQRAQMTSDAGLLPIRQLDEQLGLTAGLAESRASQPSRPSCG